MQYDASPEFISHPSGRIETSPGHDTLARVAALAGLTNLATDSLTICGITPTTVTMTA
jgi:hypothetical protein